MLSVTRLLRPKCLECHLRQCHMKEKTIYIRNKFKRRLSERYFGFFPSLWDREMHLPIATLRGGRSGLETFMKTHSYRRILKACALTWQKGSGCDQDVIKQLEFLYKNQKTLATRKYLHNTNGFPPMKRGSPYIMVSQQHRDTSSLLEIAPSPEIF